MPAGLQEQRVGEDGANSGNGERAGQHVLRTVQEYAHGKSALLICVEGNGLRTTPAARHLVIFDNPFRHFSSPDGLALVIPIAAPASASRCCLKALLPAA